MTPEAFSNALKKYAEHPAEHILNFALLRAMKQARYVSEHDIHFGLASPAYTHFTSPIRRYPDLLVHRIVKYLIKSNSAPDQAPKDDALSKMLDHCNYRERLAVDAERECKKIKQVRLMYRHYGDEFEAMIVGVTEKGIFARVNEPFCEGFIPVETLLGEYHYNEDKMELRDRKGQRVFRLGDAIEVSVIRTDLIDRTIEFGIAGEE
jgi:ribonuclease R